jgi:hypothetical protein
MQEVPMTRFCFILGAGVLCLALAEGSRAEPAAPPGEGPDVTVLVLGENDLGDLDAVLAAAKKYSHYHAASRVKGLKKGAHHIGTTKGGKKVNAHVNSKKRVTHISVHGKKHSRVHKVRSHPRHSARLPQAKRKRALLPAPEGLYRAADGRPGADAEVALVRRQPGIWFGAFVVLFPVQVYVIYVPWTVVVPGIAIAPGNPPDYDGGGEDEVRAAPGQPGSLPGMEARALGLACLTPTWRRPLRT